MPKPEGGSRAYWEEELAKAGARLKQTLRHAENCKDDHSKQIDGLRQRVAAAEAAIAEMPEP